MNEPLEPLPGLERYRLVRQLGAGVMGTVFLAEHVELGSRHAIKLLQAPTDAGVKRLLTEGRVQAGLQHPNITKVTDVVRTGGRVALVMEFIDGPDLAAFLADRGTLDLEVIDALALGILRGMRAAHAAGVLHRDLKPANILVAEADGEWVPKIADFGLAKDEMDFAGATQTGQIMGTPAYMAPEQARDSKNVDTRADVFGLGCILYELVTGRRAFQGSDLISVLAAVAVGRYAPIDTLRSVPSRMEQAIRGALVIDREHRIDSVDTLLRVWQGDTTFDAPAAPDQTFDVFGSTVGVVTEVPTTPAPAEVTTLPTSVAKSSLADPSWNLRLLVLPLLLLASIAAWFAWPSSTIALTATADMKVGLVPIRSVNMDEAAGEALTMQVRAVLEKHGIDHTDLPPATYDEEGRSQVFASLRDHPGRVPVRGAIGRLGSVFTLNLERLDAGPKDVRVHRMADDLDGLLGELEPMLLGLLNGPHEGVDQSGVRTSVRAHSQEIKSCYEDELRRQTVEGSIHLDFELKDGRATGIRVVSDTVGVPAISHCMRAKLQGWLFPANVEGRVEWPFRFRLAAPPVGTETHLSAVLRNVEGRSSGVLFAHAQVLPQPTVEEADLQHIRSALEERGLPGVLQGIPVAASALNSSRTSWACAAGPWMLMPEMAVRHGLDVRRCHIDGQEGFWEPSASDEPGLDSPYIDDQSCALSCEIDERRDLEKSTKAALGELEASWSLPEIAAHPQREALTILAYELGRHRVLQLIRKHGRDVIGPIAACEDCNLTYVERAWVFRVAAAALSARCRQVPDDPLCTAEE